MAHVIVFGNEKGGSGKSTVAVHVVVSLLQEGVRVGLIDLDWRQRTSSRFFENRAAFVARKGVNLLMPKVEVLAPKDAATAEERQQADKAAFDALIARMTQDADFIAIDCPGSDSPLSRIAHARADTLVTPVNDSFVDLDMLARIDPDSFAVQGPSGYSEMVWEARKRRLMTERRSVDWVVLRNRLASVDARNKRRVAGVLENLERRIGFRFLPGISERVIFREMFLSGLTLLDLGAPGVGVDMKMGHIAARAEVRALLAGLNLPGWEPD